MSGLRSQSAPLPRLALKECAAAYAQGNTQLGDWIYPKVVEELRAPIKRIILRDTNDPNTIEDITQETLTKLWVTLRRGVEPDFKLVTYHTIIHMYRTRSGMGDAGRAGRERSGHPITLIPIEAEHAPLRDDTEQMINAIDDDALLAELADVDPMWAIVAQYRIEGVSERQLATHLGTSRGEIRKTLAAIREHLEQRAA